MYVDACLSSLEMAEGVYQYLHIKTIGEKKSEVVAFNHKLLIGPLIAIKKQEIIVEKILWNKRRPRYKIGSTLCSRFNQSTESYELDHC